MEHLELVHQLNKLAQDPSFLELKSLQSKSNLFEIVAASHTEMWHSAFLKWLLDPNSSLGLGAYPLQRFLFMVRYEGLILDQEAGILELDLSVIEDRDVLRLSSMAFETEYTDPLLEGKRLDIYGLNDVIRITIENKIHARESEDQTAKYAECLAKTSDNFLYDIMVYLSPDEIREPGSKKFVQINYQQICDFVLKPCLVHPELTQENKYLILQYLSNLGKPLKGGRVMAQPNKDLCLKIYKAYKEVLDEIFVAVKGEAPAVRSSGEQIQSYNTTLSQLVSIGVLSMDDRLQASYKNSTYEACFAEDTEGGSVGIRVRDTFYSSPSKAATAITQKNANGWTFWSVLDANQRLKGSLAELRAKAGSEQIRQQLKETEDEHGM